MASRIAIFASGSGSNAENIIHYFKNNPAFEFPVIISNNELAFVHKKAEKLGIPTVTFSREQFMEGNEIIKCLQHYNIDYIVLAGFMLRIHANLIRLFPQKIINIHPALLPKFGGKGMYGERVHQAVKDAGEAESGITIHYVNENYDEGAVIFQTSCPVLPHDSAQDIATKVHELEYEYYPVIIQKLWADI